MAPAASNPDQQVTYVRRSAALTMGHAVDQRPFSIGLLALLAAVCFALILITKLRRKQAMSEPETKTEKPKTIDQEGEPAKVAWPWRQPPKPLPGPYEPRLYPPLPKPTIRRNSQPEQAVVTTSQLEMMSANYSRRVSTGAEGDKTYHFDGTITHSRAKEGSWRRNQWTITTG